MLLLGDGQPALQHPEFVAVRPFSAPSHLPDVRPFCMPITTRPPAAGGTPNEDLQRLVADWNCFMLAVRAAIGLLMVSTGAKSRNLEA